MNIIIPLGGKGERFAKEGYSMPKPLINILNKPMIFWVLDNLNLHTDDTVYIVYSVELDHHNFTEVVRFKYPQVVYIPVNHQTSGAVETVSVGLKTIVQLSPHKKCVLLDCDTFYTHDILSVVRNSEDSMVFYTKKDNEKPIYSYIELNRDNCIMRIQEKVKISSNANTGCYVFNDIVQLQRLCEYVLNNNITFNGEPYISCVISELIKETIVHGHIIDDKCVFSLGTPRELTTFLENAFVFLFDLDGTLVKTDKIYVKVWKRILSKYNIDLTEDIFNKYIQGNSDDKVVKTLIPCADLQSVSERKDKLFIENIDDTVIIDGAVDFIKQVKRYGHPCSIVTNCNRPVAQKIVDFCGLTKLVDFIIVGNECKRTKPYPDPYLEAIKRYNTNVDKVVIFEDSKPGLLSARQTNAEYIVGITTIYSEKELLSFGAKMAINDYLRLTCDTVIRCNNNIIKSQLIKFIKDSITLNIQDIVIDDNKLKGGFISDVLSLKIGLDTGEQLNCVAKMENTNETLLSLMAKKLGLYERENYFYESISKYVNIRTPKFYGLIRDDDSNIIGILMENLNHCGKYKLNVNLNVADIDISLGVISEMAKLHSKFWNKDIKKMFPDLKRHNDPFFNPVWANFITDKWPYFKDNWRNVLTQEQLDVGEQIVHDFPEIQERLSNKNLTLIHGDVKSPNIFYDTEHRYEPVFLDWQYIAIGKGVQDMIFFLIESFDLDNIRMNFPLFKSYYYRKLIQNGITNYSFQDYEQDIRDAVCYFPFFVAIWFGTTSQEDLIDINFPYFFIQKLFYFISFL
jgi:HAD superfamily hydrolase (TIGR01509 family)